MKHIMVFFIIALVGCTNSKPVKKVKIFTFAYPPYTQDAHKGLLVDLITEAYKSQGVSVDFDFDTLENAHNKARESGGLMLGSREYKFESDERVGFEEIFVVDTYLISIYGNEKNTRMGAFSSDEVEFANEKKLTPIKYMRQSDGIKMLYDGTVGSIICTDISCDQIKITNKNIKFNSEYAYSFPIDFIYFGSPFSEKSNIDIAIFKKGIECILENGNI